MLSSPLTAADAINLGLLTIGILTLAVGLHYSHKARMQSVRTEQATAYLSLEMYSCEVFRYEAEHREALTPYRLCSRPGALLDETVESSAAQVAVNLYFQTLNLFEVCTRFRQNGVIGADIFASWVAWFYDTLDDWYFRDLWRRDLRENYIPELKAIFDGGVAIFDRLGEADEPAIDRQRKHAFYKSVGDQLDCDRIRSWLGPVDAAVERALPAHISFSWSDGGDETAQAASFLAQALREDPSYISHGEIQCGLSPDGRHWAPDLAALLAEDLAGLGEDRSLLVARDANGIVGVAIVAWSGDGRTLYAVVEDLAVSAALRSQGLGAAMMDAIELEARNREASWIFLESGLDNHRAHAFFGRLDYAPLSKVFGKELIARRP